jgi:hypothetical protein
MASRGQSWFEPSMLLAGESLVREDRVRIRIDAPPGWWEGAIVLTTERLFVLPDVTHPSEPHVAFWLSEISSVDRLSRQRFAVHDRCGNAVEIAMTSPAVARIVRKPAQALVDAIEALRPAARTQAEVEGGGNASSSHRAIG